jgi:hypothetical protein
MTAMRCASAASLLFEIHVGKGLAQTWLIRGQSDSDLAARIAIDSGPVVVVGQGRRRLPGALPR